MYKVINFSFPFRKARQSKACRIYCQFSGLGGSIFLMDNAGRPTARFDLYKMCRIGQREGWRIGRLAFFPAADGMKPFFTLLPNGA